MAAPTLSVKVRYRNLPDAPDYLVGADGSIRVWRRGRYRRLKPTPNSDGYFQVKIRYDGGTRLRYIHHLVLETFVGPRPPGMEGCHRPDTNKANNAAHNLDWGTSESNKADMAIDGSRARGERHGRAKLREDDLPVIRRLIAEGETKAAVARKFGVSPRAISFVLEGRNWGHAAKKSPIVTSKS